MISAPIKKISPNELKERIRRLPPEKRGAAAFHANRVYGESDQKRFEPYRFDPSGYIRKFLKWTPWAGTDEKHPGQVEILDELALAVRQQIEKRDFESGKITEKDLTVWKPGDTIQNWLRVESGNGVGKTKSLSGTVNWFFDCFESIVYTFHTSATQDEVTTWKEIGKDRAGKGLPGTVLKTKLYLSADRFAMSRTPADTGGTGEEKTKGQHNEFLLFVIDEADGVKPFIFEAIETMLSGGIGVVLMTANPRSRSSKFHRLKKLTYVKTLRISSLYHPNVVQGKEIIPGAVTRDFVEKEIEKGCQVPHVCFDGCKDKKNHHKKFHDAEKFTFELPYDVKIGEQKYPSGTVFLPSHEFMTRILGIAPPTALDKTVISAGVYEAACRREPEGGDVTNARVGVDAARSGSDKGTVYIRWQDAVWKSAELVQSDTNQYTDAIKTECLKLKEKGVTSLHIRVDAGYGSGVIDALRIDAELKEAFSDYRVFEVHFGSSAYNKRDYDNVVTEMYYETAESLKEMTLVNPPEQLEIDLTEREFKFVNRQGKTRKILEPKEEFKKRTGRSPDDGDGLVLAVAPDYCFNQVNISVSSVAVAGQPPTQNKSNPLENILSRLLKK